MNCLGFMSLLVHTALKGECVLVKQLPCQFSFHRILDL